MVKMGRRLFCELAGGAVAIASLPKLAVKAGAAGNLAPASTEVERKLRNEVSGHAILVKCVGSVRNSKLFRLRGRNSERFPTAQDGEHVVFCFPQNGPDPAFHGYIREPEDTAHFVAFLSQTKPELPHIMLVALESPFASYYVWRSQPVNY